MHTFGDCIDRRPALPADSLCEAALAAFIHDPDCRAIAIVDAGRPVGVAHREAFLARMEAPGAATRPILAAAEPEPLIVDIAGPIVGFVTRALSEHPAALLGGFVVVEGGQYRGVCDLARLAPALLVAGRGLGLVERVCGEVREPVAHALAAAEGLKRMRLPDGAAAHLDTIADAAHATLSLLDIAAELQKAADGRLQIAPTPRRLQELMDDIDARWRVQAEMAGVTLLVSYDGAPDCAASLDGPRLMQVYDALIGHAMAHSARGVVEASLQVRSVEAGLVLTGRVRDNGAAYEADYLAQLFSPDGDASQVGGMGVKLSLMLAERAVLAMAGKLVARPNPGPGATLAFELAAPVADGEGAGAAEAELAPSTRSAHILVVDDNATNRMVVEALCEMFDCSTESVVDGVEAVEAARAGRFDVILMDIKMPRMDGVTATREIRKLAAPAGRVPIIALTANADADEVQQYLAAGMRGVVEKPIKPDRLLEALDSALAERAAQATAAAA
jgi:CheY-like chemotaxis protein/signal transduction histidine kinase